MFVVDKLVVITLCVSLVIVVTNARPSVVVPAGVIVPSGITTVNDGRGISTTVVEGTPLVVAAPTVVATAGIPSAVIETASGPISTTVIETIGSNEVGEVKSGDDDESSTDDGSYSGDNSDESAGSSEDVDESSGSSSDEGVEATEPSVDESAPPATVAVPAQPTEITANISPVPAATVLSAQSTVIGTVPATISSQSSTVVHSGVIVPGVAPSIVTVAKVAPPPAVVTVAESPARSIAIQAEPLQILTVPRLVNIW